MPLAKVWAKPRGGQNPKCPPAAILDWLKSAILRRFYSNNTIEVSFLTNSEVRNPFQGLFFSNFGHFHSEIQDGRHLTSDNMLKSAVPANKRNIGNFWSENVCQMNSKKWTEVSSDIFSKFWRFQIEGAIQNGRQNVLKYHKIAFGHTLDPKMRIKCFI